MGTDAHSWREVNLAGVIGAVISGVSNRMLVGNALYHNEAFMNALSSFGNVLGLASLLIGQFVPFFIRPLVGYMASVIVRAYRRRPLKFMVPAARERIDAVKRQKEDPEFEYEAPMDIMQWIISACPDASAEEIAALVLSLVGIVSPSSPTSRFQKKILFNFLFIYKYSTPYCSRTFVQLLTSNHLSTIPLSLSLSPSHTLSFSILSLVFSPFLTKGETARRKKFFTLLAADSFDFTEYIIFISTY